MWEQIRRPDAFHARQVAPIEGESYGITFCSRSFLFHSPESMLQSSHRESSGEAKFDLRIAESTSEKYPLRTDRYLKLSFLFDK
jgi:hypothetical protein